MSVRVRLKRCFFGAAGLAGAIALLLASAFPAGGFVRKPPPLPLIVSMSITGCGRITHPGYYEVDSPLTAGSDPADCIQISAANVLLNLNGQTITGLNAGSGVHVMRTGAQAYIEGGGATIADFMDGVEIDAAGASAENFVASNNLDAGVLLNHARLATVSNFSAIATGGGGGLDGVRLDGAAQNSVASFSASHLNRFGVWLVGSSHNSISGFKITYNGIAGIYLGCSMTGPDGFCKPSAPKSTFNAIFNGVSSYNSSGQAGYGVADDLADISNRFSNITAQGNATYDVFDANDICGKNAWFALTVGSAQTPEPCPD